jgi:hypothetical protein
MPEEEKKRKENHGIYGKKNGTYGKRMGYTEGDLDLCRLSILFRGANN